MFGKDGFENLIFQTELIRIENHLSKMNHNYFYSCFVLEIDKIQLKLIKYKFHNKSEKKDNFYHQNNKKCVKTK